MTRSLYVQKAQSRNLLRACRQYLAREPTLNVLPLGDLYQPLLRVSSIYYAVENHEVRGVCSIYYGYSTPTLVLGASSDNVKRALVDKATDEIPGEFVSLCPTADAKLLEETSTVLNSHLEQQMTTHSPKHIQKNEIVVDRVRRGELHTLNRFYLEHKAEAWIPIQFETGPFYCIKHRGKIVSAAGVHLVTPRVAQLGNIVTDDAFRNHGLATACVSTLGKHLVSTGRTLSLFVNVENMIAISMYQKLGFVKERELSFLVMRKSKRRPASES